MNIYIFYVPYILEFLTFSTVVIQRKTPQSMNKCMKFTSKYSMDFY